MLCVKYSVGCVWSTVWVVCAVKCGLCVLCRPVEEAVQCVLCVRYTEYCVCSTVFFCCLFGFNSTVWVVCAVQCGLCVLCRPVVDAVQCVLWVQYSVCCVCSTVCVVCTVQTSCGCSTAWTPSSLSSSSTSSRCTECRCVPRWWPERSILVSVHHMLVCEQHYLMICVGVVGFL